MSNPGIETVFQFGEMVVCAVKVLDDWSKGAFTSHHHQDVSTGLFSKGPEPSAAQLYKRNKCNMQVSLLQVTLDTDICKCYKFGSAESFYFNSFTMTMNYTIMCVLFMFMV